MVFEGPDGAGKTTTVAAVADALGGEGVRVRQINEPSTSTVLGKVAREYLVGRGERVDPYVAALLMVAARVDQHAQIDWSDVVLSDRSFLTTYVYQEEVGWRTINRLHLFHQTPAVRKPDVMFYLRVDPATAIRRTRERGKEHFSDEDVATFAETYERIVACWNDDHPAFSFPIVAVDATRPLEQVVTTCLDHLLPLLRSRAS